MATSEETVRLYAQMAEEHQKQGRPQERDRFLLLAADAALTAGKRDVAENFRRTLLARNPNHLLKPYSTLAEALASPDIANYVQELRRTYPPERIERASKSAAPGSTSLGSDKDVEEEIVLPLEAERQTKAKAPFAFLPEPEPAKPLVPPLRATAPEPRRPAPAARPGPQPLPAAAKSPGTFALKPPESIPRPAAIPFSPRYRADEPSSGWLGMLLFVVTLLGALALIGHVFVRPFLSK